MRDNERLNISRSPRQLWNALLPFLGELENRPAVAVPVNYGMLSYYKPP